jgi:glycosyltransferase involved in cell wall biosynthesis
MAKLIIHATNIHKGGGAVLLIGLLREIPSYMRTIVVVDARLVMPDDIPTHIIIQRVYPTMFARLGAEFNLARNAKIDDSVLCFGNLPPLFNVKGKISVFLQNRYLVDGLSFLGTLPIKMCLRLLVERVWLILLKNRADLYFVQTFSMKQMAEERLGIQAICAPFVPESVMYPSVSPHHESTRFDFLYVASCEAHKNHRALISAWGILASEGVYPSLALTLEPTDEPELMALIKSECKSKHMHIHNLGNLSHDELLAIYRQSRALIYPSNFESFGLPLIEARSMGLAILASELDYVRDITDPEETFDSRSPLSIARAVKRFIQRKNRTFEPLHINTFLDLISQRT